MQILPVNNSIQNSVSYILYSEDVDYCILIDCGEYEALVPKLERIGKFVKAVLLTHGHFDHICGLNLLLQHYPSCEIYTTNYGHEELRNPKRNLSLFQGTPFSIDNYNSVILIGGEELSYEGLAEIEVIATPGHDSSCLTYRIGNSLITGDSYIPGVKVFSKFPSGNIELAMRSWEVLEQMEHEGYQIYCGHHSFKNEQ